MVLATFIHAMIVLRPNYRRHAYLIAILSLCLLSEVIVITLTQLHYRFDIFYTISIFLHTTLWLHLFGVSTGNRSTSWVLISLYAAFALLNLSAMEGTTQFNFDTFLIGAFMYILFYLIVSFRQLSHEQFNFFLSNRYILLSAPVIFFFGLGMLFAFSNPELHITTIGEFTLWSIIITFVNLVYYSLINLYILNEKNA